MNTTVKGYLMSTRGRECTVGCQRIICVLDGFERPGALVGGELREIFQYRAPGFIIWEMSSSLRPPWVLFAGQSIYKLCKVNHDRRDGAPGSTPYGYEWLWGKGRGYSLGRWEFWKKRFGEIATTKELKDSLRDIAARAASKMEEMGGIELAEAR